MLVVCFRPSCVWRWRWSVCVRAIQRRSKAKMMKWRRSDSPAVRRSAGSLDPLCSSRILLFGQKSLNSVVRYTNQMSKVMRLFVLWPFLCLCWLLLFSILFNLSYFWYEAPCECCFDRCHTNQIFLPCCSSSLWLKSRCDHKMTYLGSSAWIVVCFGAAQFIQTSVSSVKCQRTSINQTNGF